LYLSVAGEFNKLSNNILGVSESGGGADKEIIYGPTQYIPARNEMVEKLTRHLAGQGMYLEVQSRSGEKTIMPGPSSL
jgi:hypothetical protein